MDAQSVAEITGLLWGPLVVVTSAWRGEANGMIAATAMRAFIIPEHPRVSVLVWKFNHTHKLIEHSRVFGLNLLSAAQLDKVHAFGFNSGTTAISWPMWLILLRQRAARYCLMSSPT